MKKFFYTIIAAAAILTACNEEVVTDGTGSLAFEVIEVSEKYQTKSTIDYSNFYVTIQGPDGIVTSDGVKYENVPFNTVPTTIEGIPSGSYTVTVSSHIDEPSAAFDTPVFEGSTTFTVKTGATAPVNVKCTVKNMKVTIQPTSDFLSELSTYTITVSNGKSSLHWTNDPTVTGENVSTDLTRAGYFSVSPLSVRIVGYRELSGEEATWDGMIEGVEDADHHIIKVTAKTTGAIGGITIDVIDDVNNKYSDVFVNGFEEVGVDGPDTGDEEDSGDDSGLELVWEANPDFSQTELKSEMDVNLTVNAVNGIKVFEVHIKSPSPSFIGAVQAIGKAGATEDSAILDFSDEKVVGSMIEIGLLAESPIGKTSVDFPLSYLLPLIIQVGEPELNSVHTFTMHLVDNKDQLLEIPLEFIYLGD